LQSAACSGCAAANPSGKTSILQRKKSQTHETATITPSHSASDLSVPAPSDDPGAPAAAPHAHPFVPFDAAAVFGRGVVAEDGAFTGLGGLELDEDPGAAYAVSARHRGSGTGALGSMMLRAASLGTLNTLGSGSMAGPAASGVSYEMHAEYRAHYERQQRELALQDSNHPQQQQQQQQQYQQQQYQHQHQRSYSAGSGSDSTHSAEHKQQQQQQQQPQPYSAARPAYKHRSSDNYDEPGPGAADEEDTIEALKKKYSSSNAAARRSSLRPTRELLPPPKPLFDFGDDAPDALAGLVLDEHGIPIPQTGAGAPMIYPFPSLPDGDGGDDGEPEPTGPPASPALITEMSTRDAQRFGSRRDEVLNRIVYDSIDQSPMHTYPPPFQPPPDGLYADNSTFRGGSGGGGGHHGHHGRDRSAAGSADHPVPPASRNHPRRPATGTGHPAIGGEAGAPAEQHAGTGDSRDPTTIGSTRAAARRPALPPYYVPATSQDSTLIFESRFESGNLRRAVHVLPYEYDLIIRPDLNTKHHAQWFLFRVGNVAGGASYRFNIVNNVKESSLYNDGMRPLIYSRALYAAEGIGWHRAGRDVCYYQNHIRRGAGGGGGGGGKSAASRASAAASGPCFYTLTFTLDIPASCDGDEIYVAYCRPYTYSFLQRYLAALCADPLRAGRVRRRELCRTLAGNRCDLLTVTTFSGDAAQMAARKGVVISARVHPGESNASWMMHGLLDFITGSSLDAKILRDNFVFKIVPMLNPDGVAAGNYRCNLAGADLNRQWADPSRKLHPTVWHTKSMLRRFITDRHTVLYCDLHGHSRRKNAFMYGCEAPRGPGGERTLRERVFPALLSMISASFSLKDCNFAHQRGKDSTARVVVAKELGLLNSFTLEASFCGPSGAPGEEFHFAAKTLMDLGCSICEAVLDYCDPDQSKAAGVLADLRNGVAPGGAAVSVFFFLFFVFWLFGFFVIFFFV
jgi:hypothetical protein